MRVEEGVGPTVMVATPAAAFATAPLAEDASEPSSGVPVDSLEDIALAVLEVFKPALQHSIEILTDRCKTAPLITPCLGTDRLFEFS